MKKFGQSLMVFIIGSLLTEGVIRLLDKAIESLDSGKDISETKFETRNRIYLNDDDFTIV